MSSVAEIEAAIERLSPVEVNEVAAWLEEYQQMINASAEMSAIYDQEERENRKSIVELFEPARGLNLNVKR